MTADICEVDKKIVRKRRSDHPTALDASSIKRRLRRYHIKTTLLDLNDHCLLTIFENLNEVDTCHVQNVCTRFVPLAESAFLSIRRRIPEISQLDYSESELRRVFYKFGNLLDITRLNGSEIILMFRSSMARIYDSCDTAEDVGRSLDNLKETFEKLDDFLK